MNLRDHLERKSETSSSMDNDGLAQKIYRPPVASWFQKRLVYVRNELKKEIQTKTISVTKNH